MKYFTILTIALAWFVIWTALDILAFYAGRQIAWTVAATIVAVIGARLAFGPSDGASGDAD